MVTSCRCSPFALTLTARTGLSAMEVLFLDSGGVYLNNKCFVCVLPAPATPTSKHTTFRHSTKPYFKASSSNDFDIINRDYKMIEKCVLTNLTIILVVVILVIVLFVRCVQSYIIAMSLHCLETIFIRMRCFHVIIRATNDTNLSGG